MITGCGDSSSESESGGGLFQAGGNGGDNFFTILLDSAQTYSEGDNLDITLSHPYQLNIEGSPRLAIDIGGNTVYADFLTGNNTKSIIFRYTVQAGDNDLDGIELPSSIDLNGGSISFAIQGVVTNVETSLPTRNTSGYLVDTIGPQIEAINIPTSDHYKEGEQLNFSIEFNENVNVVGGSKLQINAGGSLIEPTLLSHSGNTLNYAYTIQAGDNDSDGINFDSNSLVITSGSIVDSASNLADLDLQALISLPDLSGVIIDTIIPTVSLDAPANIGLGNYTGYNLSGDCSEDGRDVEINIGSLSVTEICSGGSWSTSGHDVSGQADNPSFSITVDHSDLAGNNATQVNTSVVKDTSIATVTIVSAPDINANNHLSYSASGACSVNGQIVDINIGSINFQPLCSTGAWSITNEDVSSLADANNISFTADHSNATQASNTINKDVIAPQINSVTPPSNGYYKEGENLDFLINTSEDVSVSGASHIEINLGGGTVNADYVSGSGTSALLYRYSIQAGENDTDGLDFNNSNLIIDSGAISDSLGNNLDLDLTTNTSLPSLSGIYVDTTIPTLSITSSPDITAANHTAYTISGTCSEDGEDVVLQFGSSTNVTVSCSGGSFSSGNVDVSSEADSATFTLTADHSDLAGNNATQSLVTVDKNTTLPTVTITNAPDIDQANETSYAANGTCSENGRVVELNIGSLNLLPNCSSGTWNISNIDVSSLSDSGSITFTADHDNAALVAATQASTTIAKDTTGPTVTISSAPNINSANENAYTVSGTCSENGRTVEVYIDSLNFNPNCNSGGWTTGAQDVSSIADGSGISITADHDNAAAQAATQATASVDKDTTGPTINTLSTPTSLTDAVNLAWTIVNSGGSTIDDYLIQYRVKGDSTWLSFSDGVNVNTTAQVTGLSASTIYEFRVAIAYDTSFQSGWSQLTEAETQPDNPLFSGDYILMNVGGATSTNVVALEDNTRVYLNA